MSQNRATLSVISWKRPFRTEDNDIGLNTYSPKFLYAVLGRLGLGFPAGFEERNKGNMDIHHIVPANLVFKLPDGLQKREGLNVPYGPADFRYHNVSAVIACGPPDSLLNFIGDVGNNLYSTPQEITLSLFINY